MQLWQIEAVALLADLISSLRTFRRAPALTLALLLTIALGIGSNASVLGFIRGLVARELPLPGIESIVSIFARDAQDAFGPVSFEEVLALQMHSESFESVGAVRESQSIVTIAGHLAVLSVAAVTDGLAALLTLPTQDGIVISHRVWRDEFGASAGIREAQITMDGVDRRDRRRRAGVARRPLHRPRRRRLGAASARVVARIGAHAAARSGSSVAFARASSAGRAQTSLNASRTGDRIDGRAAVHRRHARRRPAGFRASSGCCRWRPAACSSSRAPTSRRSSSRERPRARTRRPFASRSAPAAASSAGSCSPTAW